jgi:hypothetical protein
MTISPFLRRALAVSLALTLAACGGKATFPINGTITTTTDANAVVTSTLLYNGLVLTTNGMDLSVPAGAKTFSFPNTISYGDVYNVTIKTPPAHQNCTTIDQSTALETASGTAGRLASINIALTCYLNTYTIGGTVSGLTSDGLVLTNGTAGGTATIPNAATSYVFATSVTYGSSYGVTVLTQPANNVCTVSNPSGVMGDALVSNINVTCVPKPTT